MTTRALGSLTIDIVARTGAFRDGMGRAARIAESESNKIERAFLNAGKAGQALFTFSGAAAGAAGGAGLTAGNWFEKIFGGARAAGGPTQPGKLYLVGERGPELWSSSRAGYVTPITEAASGMSASMNV